MINAFKDIALNDSLQKRLTELGFIKPTEIQAKAIPQLLEAKHIDFHGQAQTGTGKTLAFGLPLLNAIDPKNKNVQALIVAPTRELVVQICDSLEQVAKYLPITITPIYGGVSMHDQLRKLKKGVHVVVGTPGRLNDHLRRKTLDLSHLQTLVLDEADIMLDMGFKEEIDEILKQCPKERSIWLFSATIKRGIETIKRSHMRNPVTISVSRTATATKQVKQYYCVIPARNRLAALARFIDQAPSFYGLIFCRTRALTSQVAQLLLKRGYKVGALHGDMNQAERNRVTQRFKDKKIHILVATDVAARGIDVANLTHVINYCIPTDQESYVHRIGRTGRAGKEGIAITFISPSEQSRIKRLERRFNFAIHPIDVPSLADIATIRLQEAAEYMALASHRSKHTGDYMDKLRHLVQEYDHDALANVVINSLHDLFFKQIKEPELEIMSPAAKERRRQKGDRPSQANYKELLLTIGSVDDITKSDLLAFVRKHAQLKGKRLGKVRLTKRQSFISVPAAEVSQIMRKLDGKKLAGRQVRVRRA